MSWGWERLSLTKSFNMCTWQRYTTRETTVSKPFNITLDKYSNGFTVKNLGNSICIVNSDPLQPGESKGFGGNQMEIMEGRYRIYFKPIDNPPVGYTQNDGAIVTEKYYIFKRGQEPKMNC